MKIASYFATKGNGNVLCELCPHRCALGEGQTGICRARINHAGQLYSSNYGKLTGLQFDPIEKKPLCRFYPGSWILSAGSFGCNFRCHWCQNAGISQAGAGKFADIRQTSSGELADVVSKHGGIGLAYTFNEPAVWFEFMMETAHKVADLGKKNVMVTNGYINPIPLKSLLGVIDAFNVDLKAFDDNVYRIHTGGGLQVVKDTLKAIAGNGNHLEVTFLIVPGVNDDLELFEGMVSWIGKELGKDKALHLSRYFPSWKYQLPETSIPLMKKMMTIASGYLDHVYLGNLSYFSTNN